MRISDWSSDVCSSDLGAVEVLRTGTRKRIDLGMIDKDYFANCAAIGISPQIAETVPHGLKKYLGRVGYLSWAALQYANFRPLQLTIEDEGVGAGDAVEDRKRGV